jgi:hypothetical protein
MVAAMPAVPDGLPAHAANAHRIGEKPRPDMHKNHHAGAGSPCGNAGACHYRRLSSTLEQNSQLLYLFT